MKTEIKEILDKPSKAVRAMIEGLKKQSQREDFEVDMHHFGGSESFNSILCFGCAATCAAQEAFKKNLSADEISERKSRAIAYGVDIKSLADFEMAIDDFRAGNYQALGKYYEIRIPYFQLPALHTINWRSNLSEYEKYADLLEECGL